MITSEVIKAQFLKYSSREDFIILPSESLIPSVPDPTLLFTNSTMSRFKKEFTGEIIPRYSKIATYQRCIRVGGQQKLYGARRELENIGESPISLTLFEQLGSCIFGEYSKYDAIHYIWSFLTKELGFSKNNLWVTTHESDNETYSCWKKVGIRDEQIVRMGANLWWQIEPSNICGPITHFLYDRGELYSLQGHKDCVITCKCGRYLDLGDLAFFQFYRKFDDKLEQLPNLHIDCGLGLERLVVVAQGVNSVFEIDSFVPIMKGVEKLVEIEFSSKRYYAMAVRAIVDHARCIVFAICDGIQPGNKGKEYIIRKVLRRAVRFGYLLGIEKPFLYRLVDVVIDTMAQSFPFLKENQENCREVILKEEKLALANQKRGIKEFQKIAKVSILNQNIISGQDIFLLYDTYGLSLEFIKLLAKEKSLQLNEEDFETLLRHQQNLGRANWRRNLKGY